MSPKSGRGDRGGRGGRGGRSGFSKRNNLGTETASLQRDGLSGRLESQELGELLDTEAFATKLPSKQDPLTYLQNNSGSRNLSFSEHLGVAL